MSFWGRYSFSMISTNFLPNDPVPPVTSTTCSAQFILPGCKASMRELPLLPSHRSQKYCGKYSHSAEAAPVNRISFNSSEPTQSRPVADYLCHTETQVPTLVTVL